MKADHIVEALTGDSGWKDMIPQVNSSDFPTQWVPSAYECSIINAQAKEIEKLRGQLPRWIPVEERLPETESWGASKVVLGIVQNESGYPPPNPCFCVYLGNQQWTIRGRMATITHWMPLPETPEVMKNE